MHIIVAIYTGTEERLYIPELKGGYIISDSETIKGRNCCVNISCSKSYKEDI